ncbi:MAG: GGDEF domain-containing protein [Planctomycetota bacterium]
MLTRPTYDELIEEDTRFECVLGGSVTSQIVGSSPADHAQSEPELMKRSTESLRPSQQSCLVQIYPPEILEGMLLIEKDRLVIGRDEGADLVIRDSSVSRQHAVLCRSESGYSIEDLDSTNGTVVAGQKVRRIELSTGDTIQIGSFLFKYLSAGSVESQYYETVYSALTRDALTGTMNKRFLLETIGRSIASAVRHQQSLSVVMIDVDHFKSVNDTYGHLVGDEVLREFGHRLAETIREDDLLARFGGEEFCLLLTATDATEASTMAERCRQKICVSPFETSIGPLAVTASFGVASLDLESGGTGTELIQAADRSLYSAKRSGRNRVETSQSSTPTSSSKD